MAWLAVFLPVSAVIQYVDAWRSPWTLAVHLLVVLAMMDRFILGMHVHVHRPWFRVRLLNRMIPNFVGLFFGQTIGTYFAHHVAMHHPEDNGARDLSSTRAYRRDHLGDLARYVGRFLLVGVFELIAYFRRRGRPEIARRVALGELATWAAIGLALWVDVTATLFVFVLPILIARTMMMIGNWGQHAFLNPRRGDAWGSATNIIDSRHNRRCFNNGHHILHHLRPALHWSELPAHFEAERERYATHEAVVFARIPSFQLLSLALVTRRWAWLESKLLRFEGDVRSPEERIAFLQARARPLRD